MGYALQKDRSGELNATLRAPNKSSRDKDYPSFKKAYAAIKSSTNASYPDLERLPNIKTGLLGSFLYGSLKAEKGVYINGFNVSRTDDGCLRLQAFLRDKETKKTDPYERVIEYRQRNGCTPNTISFICPSCYRRCQILFISVHKQGYPLQCSACTNCLRAYQRGGFGTKKPYGSLSLKPVNRYYHLQEKMFKHRKDINLPSMSEYCSIEFDTRLARKEYRERAAKRLRPIYENTRLY